MTNPFAAIASDQATQLIEATAKLADVNIEELCASREAPIFLARATAIWIMRHRMKLTTAEIGRAFGKNHASVINALKRADHMMQTHSMLRDLRDKLIEDVEKAA
jgi:chromosomal replication initiation ATPase DnaA